MLDNIRTLDLTERDIELIESALHTQKKILSMQSQAGGRGARKKLIDLKHLMKRINRSTPDAPAQRPGFLRSALSFFLPDQSYTHPR